MAHAPAFGQNGQIDAEHTLAHARTCVGCRAVLQLVVVGKGDARYSEGDATTARHEAKQAAAADAALLAGLVACPRCGAREGRAVRAVALHAIVRLVLAAAVLGIADWIERSAGVELTLLWVVAAGIAWVLFVSAVAVNIRRLVGAKKRVTITVSEAGAPARIIATPVASKLEMQ
jgi:hypothetical protein